MTIFFNYFIFIYYNIKMKNNTIILIIFIALLFFILVLDYRINYTKKIRNIGSELGGALKGFKNAVKDDETGKNEPSENAEENNGETVDVTAEKVAEKDEEEQDL